MPSLFDPFHHDSYFNFESSFFHTDCWRITFNGRYKGEWCRYNLFVTVYSFTKKCAFRQKILLNKEIYVLTKVKTIKIIFECSNDTIQIPNLHNDTIQNANQPNDTIENPNLPNYTIQILNLPIDTIRILNMPNNNLNPESNP